jgi:hypothetical protein
MCQGTDPTQGCDNLSGAAVTREELYELVWSVPVRRAATRFGISDVALAKQCRREQIPIPPRGYWARKAAGQSVQPAPLPPFVEPPPPPRKPTAQELREQERQRQAAERAAALALEHAGLPLVCFEDDLARALGVPLRRIKRLVAEGGLRIPQLPYFGLSRKARHARRGHTTEAKPCWSKYAVLQFLAKSAWERQACLRTRNEYPTYSPSPRREHQYVRYLKGRARWGS